MLYESFIAIFVVLFFAYCIIRIFYVAFKNMNSEEFISSQESKNFKNLKVKIGSKEYVNIQKEENTYDKEVSEEDTSNKNYSNQLKLSDKVMYGIYSMFKEAKEVIVFIGILLFSLVIFINHTVNKNIDSVDKSDLKTHTYEVIEYEKILNSDKETGWKILYLTDKNEVKEIEYFGKVIYDDDLKNDELEIINYDIEKLELLKEWNNDKVLDFKKEIEKIEEFRINDIDKVKKEIFEEAK